MRGWRFPRFAEDDVTGFLVEEALAWRLEMVEADEAERAAALADARLKVEQDLAAV